MRNHDLSNRLHTSIWLLKTYAISAGMYASQIWATPYLQQEMDSPLQKWLLAVLKRMCRVRDATPSWCVMRECGLEPLRFNWFRAACGCTNLCLNFTATPGYTMKKVLHADMQLSTRSNDCWKKKNKIRKSQKITSPWSQATKTFEPHGLLGGDHGDRQAFITGST